MGDVDNGAVYVYPGRKYKEELSPIRFSYEPNTPTFPPSPQKNPFKKGAIFFHFWPPQMPFS